MNQLGFKYIRTDRDRIVIRVPGKKAITINPQEFGSGKSALEYAISIRNQLVK